MYKSLLFTILSSFISLISYAQSFTVDNNEVCAGTVVTAFNTTPGGPPAQWEWTLINLSNTPPTIDGIATNVSWNLFSANISKEGNFQICLRIGPPGSTQRTCTTVTGLGLPVPNFSANPSSNICIGDQIQFTDQSTPGNAPIVSWFWELEGASPPTSEEQNPILAFGELATPGSKDLTLVVKDAKGCESSGASSIFKDAISIDVPPVPSFTLPGNIACTVPYTVTISNTTTNTPGLTYLWELSDGQTSTDRNPTFTINTSDDIDVKLTVSNATCSRERIVSKGLSATSLGIDILTSIETGCPPLVVVVGASNTTGNLTYNWTFPGSNVPSSTTKNNTVIYNSPGTYTITLNASSGDCSDVATKTITVTDAPVANFSVDNPADCLPPHDVTVTNNSTGASEFLWSFPGGSGANIIASDPGTITYNNIGEYPITLIASTGNGCSDTFTVNPAVAIGNPLVNLTVDKRQGCVGDLATFTVQTTVPDGVVEGTAIWDFGDGTTGTGKNVSHNFPAGSFNACVTIPYTGNGCTDVTRCINVRRGGPPGKPSGTIPSVLCVGESFIFQCNSLGPGISCYWKPGDNTKVQGCTAPYNYSDPNESVGFEVELVCAQNGCKDSSIIGNIIVVPPQANMEIRPVCGSLTQFDFVDLSQKADRSYFVYSINNGPKQIIQEGENSPVATKRLEFAANAPGFVDVKIVALRRDNGCRDSLSQRITLPEPLSPPKMEPRNGCVGTTVVFSDSLAAIEAQAFTGIGNRLVGWTWDFKSDENPATPPIASSTGQKVKYTYTEGGDFKACLIRTYEATSLAGITTCTEEICYDITINGVEVVMDVSPLGGCSPLNVTFNDASVANIGNIQSREWFFNGTPTSNQKTFSETFSQDTLIWVRLEVEDNQGCGGKDSLQVRVGNAIANIDVDERITCAGGQVNFSADSSIGANLAYFWDFGDCGVPTFCQSTEPNPSHIYNSTGLYTVTLRIEDTIAIKNGVDCRDEIVKTGYIEVVDFEVDFIGAPLSAPCPNLITEFQLIPPFDRFEYEVLTWDFGNGKEGIGSNPIKSIYTNIGEPGENGPFYDVKLNVKTLGGCEDEVIKPAYVEVGGPGGDFTFTPDSGCVGETVTYTHQTRGATRYFWSFHNRPLIDIVTPPGVPQNNFVEPMTQGGVFNPTLIIEDNAGCKVSIEDKVLRISGLIGYAKPDSVVICDQGTVLFEDSSYLDLVNAISDPGDEITGYVWTLNGEVINTSTSFSYDFGPADEGSNDVILTANSLFDCKADDTVKVDVLITPTPAIPGDKIICRGDDVELNIVGDPGLMVNWSPETEVDDPSSLSPRAFPITDTTLQVVFWEDKDMRCSDSAFVRINVITDLMARAGPDTIICLGDTLQLFADAINTSNGNAQFVWSPPDFLDDSDPRNPIVWPPIDFTYNVEVSEPSGFCNTERIPVNIVVGQLPTVNGGVKITGTNETPRPEVYTFGGQSVDLSAFSPTNVEYSWSISNGASLCNDCQNTTASPTSYTEYVVRVDEIGCVNYDTVEVFVLDDCEGSEITIANAFTPNNDGVNDVIGIDFGPGVEGIIFFRVFNRWGEVVFEDDSPEDQVWDGTHNGKPLNPGVYVYYLEFLCVDGNTAIRKGNITLLK